MGRIHLDSGRTRPDLGRTRLNLGRIRRMLAEVDLICQIQAKVNQNCVEFGQIWAAFDYSSSDFDQTRPISTKFDRVDSDFGPLVADFSQTRAASTSLGPTSRAAVLISTKFGRVWVLYRLRKIGPE